MVSDLLIILAAGLMAGMLCKRFKLSVLVGYLLVGVALGDGALGWVSEDNHELEYLAEAGVFLLLFSIGLEFSLVELGRLARYLVVGGSIQMALVAGPVGALLLSLGMGWQSAILIAAATAFSSTVIVFKTLGEWGHTMTPYGRRAIGVLLFQDAALIPLLLLVPLLTGAGQVAGPLTYILLLVTSSGFVCCVVLLRMALARWIIPALTQYRSAELVVLFTLVVLGGVTLQAHAMGLPTAVGAFAAGLLFSGNRWTRQIEAFVLPFREACAAIFFVSLGLLLDPLMLSESPASMFGAFVGLVLLKAGAAALALRVTGLPWPVAGGMGLGLAHIGEFALVLVLLGWESGVVTGDDYNAIVGLALGSLLLTPLLFNVGLRWVKHEHHAQEGTAPIANADEGAIKTAVVVGLGPVGQGVATYLRRRGQEVWLIDLSPVNLYPYAQQGFHTVVGDATDTTILANAHALDAHLIVVCVSDDFVALRIVQGLRRIQSRGSVVVRCRYEDKAAMLRSAGATLVISEETQMATSLTPFLDRVDMTRHCLGPK